MVLQYVVHVYVNDCTVIFTGSIPILNFPVNVFLTYELYAEDPLTAFFDVTFQTIALCVPYASIGLEVEPLVRNTPTAFNVTTVPPNMFFNFNVEVIVLS